MCHISIQLVHQSFNVMQSSGHTLLGMSKLDCNKPTVLIYIIKPSKYTPLKNTLSHRQKRVDIYKILPSKSTKTPRKETIEQRKKLSYAPKCWHVICTVTILYNQPVVKS